MLVDIRDVKTRKDLRIFIGLPEHLHKGHRNWVPPIYMDDRAYFDRRKNPAFGYSDTKLILAYRHHRPVGRIMGIVNRRYNEYRNERNARFGYLECPEDQESAHALLAAVEDWARERGAEKLVGPMGFSDQDPEGFLIAGFEHPPTLATYYNFEFMPRLLEKEGFSKEVDYVVYKIDPHREIPDVYRKIPQRIARKKEFEVLEFRRRRDLKSYILPIFRLMNECFKDIYGYLPLNEKEMTDLAKRYLPLVDPRFIKIVRRRSDVVAFIIGIPNLAEGIRKAKGRLFPVGIFKILRAAKKARQLDLLLGGIKESYRGRGLDVAMGFRVIEEARKAGFESIDSHHELETNLKVRAEMERFGGEVYKRFRIYQKPLGPLSIQETREKP
jgi:GNAT superfamily N-acetyltransferase